MNETNVKSIVINKVDKKSLMTITYEIIDKLFSITLEVNSISYSYYAYEIQELLTGTIQLFNKRKEKIIDDTEFRMEELEICPEYNNVYMRIHSNLNLVLYID